MVMQYMNIGIWYSTSLSLEFLPFINPGIGHLILTRKIGWLLLHLSPAFQTITSDLWMQHAVINCYFHSCFMIFLNGVTCYFCVTRFCPGSNAVSTVFQLCDSTCQCGSQTLWISLFPDRKKYFLLYKCLKKFFLLYHFGQAVICIS